MSSLRADMYQGKECGTHQAMDSHSFGGEHTPVLLNNFFIIRSTVVHCNQKDFLTIFNFSLFIL